MSWKRVFVLLLVTLLQNSSTLPTPLRNEDSLTPQVETSLHEIKSSPVISSASSPTISKSTTVTSVTIGVTEEKEESTFVPQIPAPYDDDCTIGPNPDQMTQDQFSSQLTDGCRYDKQVKPDSEEPLPVTLLLDIRHMESVDQLQFKIHMLVQFKYVDSRLDYTKISPKRGPLTGEAKLRDKIWIPHTVIYNEQDTNIMGLESKDIYVSISPSGEVIYSYRMNAIVYCWMDLKKFPFDEQICDVNFRSWTYNESQLHLHWMNESVSVAGQLHLTEFRLNKHWTDQTKVNASLTHHGAFSGEFDNLVLKFQLSREIGFYIMDYFIPSILLVCTSWLTFWLQADNTAPRVTLGTSTMLSFITLASSQSKSLPKVQYIKANEIWFLGCTMFIFASMAEFAFVNIIWRRKKIIELKKVNTKQILKSTLTPKLARRDLQRSMSASNLHKSHSCSSLYGNSNRSTIDNNYLTVNSYSSLAVPTITMHMEDDATSSESRRQSDSITVPMRSTVSDDHYLYSPWTTMSPHDIAQWIDKRSRLLFPTAFLIFNIFYWSFVYVL